MQLKAALRHNVQERETSAALRKKQGRLEDGLAPRTAAYVTLLEKHQRILAENAAQASTLAGQQDIVSKHYTQALFAGLYGIHHERIAEDEGLVLDQVRRARRQCYTVILYSLSSSHGSNSNFNRIRHV